MIAATAADAGVRVLPDVRVPMRDGVELSARLYLPATNEPAPTLLRYTPYLNDGFSNGLNDVAQRFFASRGFVAVGVDIRGYGKSDGVPPTAFADQEAIDGFDVIEWLARQPWSTGRTGIWGASYGGNTALAIAALRPPSLRAIVPIHAIDSEFQGAGWPHGCRGALVGEVDWGPRMIGTQLVPPLRFGDRWLERWRARLEALDQPFPFAWHTLPPETWARWTTDIAAIEVPTLAVSAWHDSYPRETVDYWRRLRSEKRLVLGPWKHELPDFAVHDPIGFFDVVARWFEYFLGDGSMPLPIWRRCRSSKGSGGVGGRARRGRRPPQGCRCCSPETTGRSAKARSTPARPRIAWIRPSGSLRCPGIGRHRRPRPRATSRPTITVPRRGPPPRSTPLGRSPGIRRSR